MYHTPYCYPGLSITDCCSNLKGFISYWS